MVLFSFFHILIGLINKNSIVYKSVEDNEFPDMNPLVASDKLENGAICMKHKYLPWPTQL
jgi:hypothetical protein